MLSESSRGNIKPELEQFALRDIELENLIISPGFKLIWPVQICQHVTSFSLPAFPTYQDLGSIPWLIMQRRNLGAASAQLQNMWTCQTQQTGKMHQTGPRLRLLRKCVHETATSPPKGLSFGIIDVAF